MLQYRPVSLLLHRLQHPLRSPASPPSHMHPQAPSQPVTPTWFSDRSPSITPQQSALIVAALKHPSIRMLNQDGWLETDPKQYELQANPRAFGWTLKVQSLLPWLQASLGLQMWG